MKLFIYKTLIFFFLLFVFFQITFGYVIRDYENKIMNSFSEDKIEHIRNKIRDEMRSSIDKERILSTEDAILLKKFLQKIDKEINAAK